MGAGRSLGLENIEAKLCFPILVFNHVISADLIQQKYKSNGAGASLGTLW